MLTRPVAKWFVVVIVAFTWAASRSPRRLGMAAIALAAYLVCAVPWMYVNSQTYGFFGISRGEGLGLFMRAFDVERFPPSEHTQFPEVDAAFRQLAPAEPYMHYRLRDELNYQRGYSAAGVDKMMEGFALEAIAAHPVSFGAGVLVDWIALFVSPHRSVGICQHADGPVLCAERNSGDSLPAFPNTPSPGFMPLKKLVAGYFDTAYWMTPLLAPLALCGALLSLIGERRDRAVTMRRLLLAAAIAYFSLVSVTFNTVEDRYRLPVDAFILLFALTAVPSAVAMVRMQRNRRDNAVARLVRRHSESPYTIAS
jgi:hypothetical protein